MTPSGGVATPGERKDQNNNVSEVFKVFQISKYASIFPQLPESELQELADDMLTWDKEKFGIGRWLRAQTEHCILATNGNPKMDSASTPNILRAPSTGHSQKPDEFYELVDRICFGPKLDYFARKKRDGWDSYGTLENETNETPEVTA